MQIGRNGHGLLRIHIGPAGVAIRYAADERHEKADDDAHELAQDFAPVAGAQAVAQLGAVGRAGSNKMFMAAASLASVMVRRSRHHWSSAPNGDRLASAPQPKLAVAGFNSDQALALRIIQADERQRGWQ